MQFVVYNAIENYYLQQQITKSIQPDL